MYRGFELTNGMLYKNRNGIVYRCIRRTGKDAFVMKSVSSGWTFTAHMITCYNDGTIEWDFSKGGCFE